MSQNQQRHRSRLVFAAIAFMIAIWVFDFSPKERSTKAMDKPLSIEELLEQEETEQPQHYLLEPESEVEIPSLYADYEKEQMAIQELVKRMGAVSAMKWPNNIVEAEAAENETSSTVKKTTTTSRWSFGFATFASAKKSTTPASPRKPSLDKKKSDASKTPIKAEPVAVADLGTPNKNGIPDDLSNEDAEALRKFTERQKLSPEERTKRREQDHRAKMEETKNLLRQQKIDEEARKTKVETTGGKKGGSPLSKVEVDELKKGNLKPDTSKTMGPTTTLSPSTSSASHHVDSLKPKSGQRVKHPPGASPSFADQLFNLRHLVRNDNQPRTSTGNMPLESEGKVAAEEPLPQNYHNPYPLYKVNFHSDFDDRRFAKLKHQQKRYYDEEKAIYEHASNNTGSATQAGSNSFPPFSFSPPYDSITIPDKFAPFFRFYPRGTSSTLVEKEDYREGTTLHVVDFKEKAGRASGGPFGAPVYQYQSVVAEFDAPLHATFVFADYPELMPGVVIRLDPEPNSGSIPGLNAEYRHSPGGNSPVKAQSSSSIIGSKNETYALGRFTVQLLVAPQLLTKKAFNSTYLVAEEAELVGSTNENGVGTAATDVNGGAASLAYRLPQGYEDTSRGPNGYSKEHYNQADFTTKPMTVVKRQQQFWFVELIVDEILSITFKIEIPVIPNRLSLHSPDSGIVNYLSGGDTLIRTLHIRNPELYTPLAIQGFILDRVTPMEPLLLDRQDYTDPKRNNWEFPPQMNNGKNTIKNGQPQHPIVLSAPKVLGFLSCTAPMVSNPSVSRSILEIVTNQGFFAISHVIVFEANIYQAIPLPPIVIPRPTVQLTLATNEHGSLLNQNLPSAALAEVFTPSVLAALPGAAEIIAKHELLQNNNKCRPRSSTSPINRRVLTLNSGGAEQEQQRKGSDQQIFSSKRCGLHRTERFLHEQGAGDGSSNARLINWRPFYTFAHFNSQGGMKGAAAGEPSQPLPVELQEFESSFENYDGHCDLGQWLSHPDVLSVPYLGTAARFPTSSSSASSSAANQANDVVSTGAQSSESTAIVFEIVDAFLRMAPPLRSAADGATLTLSDNLRQRSGSTGDLLTPAFDFSNLPALYELLHLLESSQTIASSAKAMMIAGKLLGFQFSFAEQQWLLAPTVQHSKMSRALEMRIIESLRMLLDAKLAQGAGGATTSATITEHNANNGKKKGQVTATSSTLSSLGHIESPGNNATDFIFATYHLHGVLNPVIMNAIGTADVFGPEKGTAEAHAASWERDFVHNPLFGDTANNLHKNSDIKWYSEHLQPESMSEAFEGIEITHPRQSKSVYADREPATAEFGVPSLITKRQKLVIESILRSGAPPTPFSSATQSNKASAKPSQTFPHQQPSAPLSASELFRVLYSHQPKASVSYPCISFTPYVGQKYTTKDLSAATTAMAGSAVNAKKVSFGEFITNSTACHVIMNSLGIATHLPVKGIVIVELREVLSPTSYASSSSQTSPSLPKRRTVEFYFGTHALYGGASARPTSSNSSLDGDTLTSVPVKLYWHDAQSRVSTPSSSLYQGGKSSAQYNVMYRERRPLPFVAVADASSLPGPSTLSSKVTSSASPRSFAVPMTNGNQSVSLLLSLAYSLPLTGFYGTNGSQAVARPRTPSLRVLNVSFSPRSERLGTVIPSLHGTSLTRQLAIRTLAASSFADAVRRLARPTTRRSVGEAVPNFYEKQRTNGTTEGATIELSVSVGDLEPHRQRMQALMNLYGCGPVGNNARQTSQIGCDLNPSARYESRGSGAKTNNKPTAKDSATSASSIKQRKPAYATLKNLPTFIVSSIAVEAALTSPLMVDSSVLHIAGNSINVDHMTLIPAPPTIAYLSQRTRDADRFKNHFVTQIAPEALSAPLAAGPPLRSVLSSVLSPVGTRRRTDSPSINRRHPFVTMEKDQVLAPFSAALSFPSSPTATSEEFLLSGAIEATTHFNNAMMWMSSRAGLTAGGGPLYTLQVSQRVPPPPAWLSSLLQSSSPATDKKTSSDMKRTSSVYSSTLFRETETAYFFLTRSKDALSSQTFGVSMQKHPLTFNTHRSATFILGSLVNSFAGCHHVPLFANASSLQAGSGTLVPNVYMRSMHFPNVSRGQPLPSLPPNFPLNHPVYFHRENGSMTHGSVLNAKTQYPATWRCDIAAFGSDREDGVSERFFAKDVHELYKNVGSIGDATDGDNVVYGQAPLSTSPLLTAQLQTFFRTKQGLNQKAIFLPLRQETNQGIQQQPRAPHYHVVEEVEVIVPIKPLVPVIRRQPTTRTEAALTRNSLMKDLSPFGIQQNTSIESRIDEAAFTLRLAELEIATIAALVAKDDAKETLAREDSLASTVNTEAEVLTLLVHVHPMARGAFLASAEAQLDLRRKGIEVLSAVNNGLAAKLSALIKTVIRREEALKQHQGTWSNKGSITQQQLPATRATTETIKTIAKSVGSRYPEDRALAADAIDFGLILVGDEYLATALSNHNDEMGKREAKSVEAEEVVLATTTIRLYNPYLDQTVTVNDASIVATVTGEVSKTPNRFGRYFITRIVPNENTTVSTSSETPSVKGSTSSLASEKSKLKSKKNLAQRNREREEEQHRLNEVQGPTTSIFSISPGCHIDVVVDYVQSFAANRSNVKRSSSLSPITGFTSGQEGTSNANEFLLKVHARFERESSSAQVPLEIPIHFVAASYLKVGIPRQAATSEKEESLDNDVLGLSWSDRTTLSSQQVDVSDSCSPQATDTGLGASNNESDFLSFFAATTPTTSSRIASLSDPIFIEKALRVSINCSLPVGELLPISAKALLAIKKDAYRHRNFEFIPMSSSKLSSTAVSSTVLIPGGVHANIVVGKVRFFPSTDPMMTSDQQHGPTSTNSVVNPISLLVGEAPGFVPSAQVSPYNAIQARLHNPYIPKTLFSQWEEAVAAAALTLIGRADCQSARPSSSRRSKGIPLQPEDLVLPEAISCDDEGDDTIFPTFSGSPASSATISGLAGSMFPQDPSAQQDSAASTSSIAPAIGGHTPSSVPIIHLRGAARELANRHMHYAMAWQPHRRNSATGAEVGVDEAATVAALAFASNALPSSSNAPISSTASSSPINACAAAPNGISKITAATAELYHPFPVPAPGTSPTFPMLTSNEIERFYRRATESIQVEKALLELNPLIAAKSLSAPTPTAPKPSVTSEDAFDAEPRTHRVLNKPSLTRKNSGDDRNTDLLATLKLEGECGFPLFLNSNIRFGMVPMYASDSNGDSTTSSNELSAEETTSCRRMLWVPVHNTEATPLHVTLALLSTTVGEDKELLTPSLKAQIKETMKEALLNGKQQQQEAPAGKMADIPETAWTDPSTAFRLGPRSSATIPPYSTAMLGPIIYDPIDIAARIRKYATPSTSSSENGGPSPDFDILLLRNNNTGLDISLVSAQLGQPLIVLETVLDADVTSASSSLATSLFLLNSNVECPADAYIAATATGEVNVNSLFSSSVSAPNRGVDFYVTRSEQIPYMASYGDAVLNVPQIIVKVAPWKASASEAEMLAAQAYLQLVSSGTAFGTAQFSLNLRPEGVIVQSQNRLLLKSDFSLYKLFSGFYVSASLHQSPSSEFEEKQLTALEIDLAQLSALSALKMITAEVAKMASSASSSASDREPKDSPFMQWLLTGADDSDFASPSHKLIKKLITGDKTGTPVNSAPSRAGFLALWSNFLTSQQFRAATTIAFPELPTSLPDAIATSILSAKVANMIEQFTLSADANKSKFVKDGLAPHRYFNHFNALVAVKKLHSHRRSTIAAGPLWSQTSRRGHSLSDGVPSALNTLSNFVGTGILAGSSEISPATQLIAPLLKQSHPKFLRIVRIHNRALQAVNITALRVQPSAPSSVTPKGRRVTSSSAAISSNPMSAQKLSDVKYTVFPMLSSGGATNINDMPAMCKSYKHLSSSSTPQHQLQAQPDLLFETVVKRAIADIAAMAVQDGSVFVSAVAFAALESKEMYEEELANLKSIIGIVEKNSVPANPPTTTSAPKQLQTDAKLLLPTLKRHYQAALRHFCDIHAAKAATSLVLPPGASIEVAVQMTPQNTKRSENDGEGHCVVPLISSSSLIMEYNFVQPSASGSQPAQTLRSVYPITTVVASLDAEYDILKSVSASSSQPLVPNSEGALSASPMSAPKCNIFPPKVASDSDPLSTLFGTIFIVLVALVVSYFTYFVVSWVHLRRGGYPIPANLAPMIHTARIAVGGHEGQYQQKGISESLAAAAAQFNNTNNGSSNPYASTAGQAANGHHMISPSAMDPTTLAAAAAAAAARYSIDEHGATWYLPVDNFGRPASAPIILDNSNSIVVGSDPNNPNTLIRISLADADLYLTQLLGRNYAKYMNPLTGEIPPEVLFKLKKRQIKLQRKAAHVAATQLQEQQAAAQQLLASQSREGHAHSNQSQAFTDAPPIAPQHQHPHLHHNVATSTATQHLEQEAQQGEEELPRGDVVVPAADTEATTEDATNHNAEPKSPVTPRTNTIAIETGTQQPFIESVGNVASPTSPLASTVAGVPPSAVASVSNIIETPTVVDTSSVLRIDSNNKNSGSVSRVSSNSNNQSGSATVAAKGVGASKEVTKKLTKKQQQQQQQKLAAAVKADNSSSTPIETKSSAEIGGPKAQEDLPPGVEPNPQQQQQQQQQQLAASQSASNSVSEPPHSATSATSVSPAVASAPNAQPPSKKRGGKGADKNLPAPSVTTPATAATPQPLGVVSNQNAAAVAKSGDSSEHNAEQQTSATQPSQQKQGKTPVPKPATKEPKRQEPKASAATSPSQSNQSKQPASSAVKVLSDEDKLNLMWANAKPSTSSNLQQQNALPKDATATTTAPAPSLAAIIGGGANKKPQLEGSAAAVTSSPLKAKDTKKGGATEASVLDFFTKGSAAPTSIDKRPSPQKTETTMAASEVSSQPSLSVAKQGALLKGGRSDIRRKSSSASPEAIGQQRPPPTTLLDSRRQSLDGLLPIIPLGDDHDPIHNSQHQQHTEPPSPITVATAVQYGAAPVSNYQPTRISPPVTSTASPNTNVQLQGGSTSSTTDVAALQRLLQQLRHAGGSTTSAGHSPSTSLGGDNNSTEQAVVPPTAAQPSTNGFTVTAGPAAIGSEPAMSQQQRPPAHAIQPTGTDLSQQQQQQHNSAGGTPMPSTMAASGALAAAVAAQQQQQQQQFVPQQQPQQYYYYPQQMQQPPGYYGGNAMGAVNGPYNRTAFNTFAPVGPQQTAADYHRLQQQQQLQILLQQQQQQQYYASLYAQQQQAQQTPVGGAGAAMYGSPYANPAMVAQQFYSQQQQQQQQQLNPMAAAQPSAPQRQPTPNPEVHNATSNTNIRRLSGNNQTESRAGSSDRNVLSFFGSGAGPSAPSAIGQSVSQHPSPQPEPHQQPNLPTQQQQPPPTVGILGRSAIESSSSAKPATQPKPKQSKKAKKASAFGIFGRGSAEVEDEEDVLAMATAPTMQPVDEEPAATDDNDEIHLTADAAVSPTASLTHRSAVQNLFFDAFTGANNYFNGNNSTSAAGNANRVSSAQGSLTTGANIDLHALRHPHNNSHSATSTLNTDATHSPLNTLLRADTNFWGTTNNNNGTPETTFAHSIEAIGLANGSVGQQLHGGLFNPLYDFGNTSFRSDGGRDRQGSYHPLLDTSDSDDDLLDLDDEVFMPQRDRQ